MVDFTVTAGSATPHEDFVPARGTLMFPPGQMKQSLTVAVLQDDVVENDETVVLSLSPVRHELANNTSYLGTPCEAVLTIRDDESAGEIGLSSSVLSVLEAAREAKVVVTRKGGVSGGVTVEYEAVAGTASAPDDFTGVAGTLVFAAGEAEKAITIPIADDSVPEDAETLSLRLFNPSVAATLAPQSETLIWIADDDT
jgi:hypothetical protein